MHLSRTAAPVAAHTDQTGRQPRGGILLDEKARGVLERRFAVFSLVLLLVLIFPVFAVANRVQPMILGLPFSLAWIVFWLVVEFIGVIAFYRAEYGRRAEE